MVTAVGEGESYFMGTVSETGPRVLQGQWGQRQLQPLHSKNNKHRYLPFLDKVTPFDYSHESEAPIR